MLKSPDKRMAEKKKSSGKSTFNRLNQWLHLWLGLISGIIVFVVCLTGTLFVFHDEVNEFVNRRALTVDVPQNAVRVPADSIIANMRQAYPGVAVSGYTVFRDPSRSIHMMCFNRDDKRPYRGMGSAYANPYTGQIIKVDYTYGIFRWLAAIHTNLLLDKTGTHMVEIATVIFLIELITGLIWWWPKKWTKAAREKSFKIKWNAKWRRVNIDLHNVLGFYSLVLAIVLTVTGLILSYEPVKKIFFIAFGGNADQKPVYQMLPKADSLKTPLPLEYFVNKYSGRYPDYRLISSSVPGPRSGAVTVKVAHETSMVTYRGKIFYLDAYTGKAIDLPEEAVKNARYMNMNIALHIGTWYGLPAKILTFIVCLICTSLPVTGFIIWLGKKKKGKKREELPVRAVPENAIPGTGRPAPRAAPGFRPGLPGKKRTGSPG